MNPRQDSLVPPTAEPPTTRGSGGASRVGKKLAPLDTFTQEEL
jgi:hypothetical protein